MKFSWIFKLALNSLSGNKLRSMLTILSISVGVFSTVSVMTVIDVLSNSIEGGLSVMGTNAFQISKMPQLILNGEDFQKYRGRPNITYTEIDAFQRLMEDYAKVTPIKTKNVDNISYQKNRLEGFTEVYGANEYALDAYNYKLDMGRSFTKDDVTQNRFVALIGGGIQDDLFPASVNPIGEAIRIKGVPFTVIGVLEKKGSGFGKSQDNIIVLPFSTFLLVTNTGKNQNFNVVVIAPFSNLYQETMNRSESALRIVRKLKPEQENNFQMEANNGLLDLLNTIEGTVKTASFLISIIALITAGIGIMNIMLVNVVERTKEIGVRKALGSKQSYILKQFLIEAFLLCQFGCFIGIFMGVSIGNIAAFVLSTDIVFPWFWAMMSIATCFIIGVGFGLLPAYKAARLDPIEALRF